MIRSQVRFCKHYKNAINSRYTNLPPHDVAFTRVFLFSAQYVNSTQKPIVNTTENEISKNNYLYGVEKQFI